MEDTLIGELSHALGAVRVASLSPIAGGDVSRAFRARLSDGTSVFVKTHDQPPAGLYEREAQGLRWLAQPGALRTPPVLAVSARLLALGWVEPGARTPRFEERLGEGLARLHAAAAPAFGLDHDNFIGPLGQSNRPHPSFASFYRDERLGPLVRRARDRGLLSRGSAARFERLCAGLDGLLASDEPPARLHGDLWSGNVLCDGEGEPVLVDPAVYGGEREVDLAMLALFGRPTARFYAAYDAVYPRRPGSAERTALLQLYPLLVHVLLFGGGYVAQLDDALSRYA